MSVTYVKYPAGYPKTVRRVVRAGDRWAIESDTWHTATSHDGWRRGSDRYQTAADAEAVIADMRSRDACIAGVDCEIEGEDGNPDGAGDINDNGTVWVVSDRHEMKTLTITYNPEHLGDIPGDEYADAGEEAISEYFGGEYEYHICPGSVLSTRIDLDGPWPEGAEETIDHLQQAAWEKCCGRGQ